MSILLYWLVIFALCFTGTPSTDKPTPTFATEMKSMEKYYDALRALDIDIPEGAETLEPFTENTDDAGIYAYLLTNLGLGDFDRETLAMIPLTDGVYAFDMELAGVEEGYTDLLQAIGRMSGGSLQFDDISIHIDEEALEAGFGSFPITYTINGKPCEYTAELNNDWFDPKFLNALNEQLADFGDKRLWFMLPDIQIVDVFYRDAAWVERFQKVTGLSLIDDVYAENSVF